MGKRAAVAALAFSMAGFASLVSNEGYTDRAVIPTKGDVPTIGFGTTHGVKMGDRIDPITALNRAARDVETFETAIRRCVKVPLTQGEWDVYVEMAYNIGAPGFCNSTMVRRLNAGDYEGACHAITMWKFVGKQDCSIRGNTVCMGLWQRRLQAESDCLAEQRPQEADTGS